MKPGSHVNAANWIDVWPDVEHWTEEQRRRAESLALARLIFPNVAAPNTLVPVARWVSTGAWE